MLIAHVDVWPVFTDQQLSYICVSNFQLLDLLLGHGHKTLFRRAELKTLVNFHGNEVWKIQILASTGLPFFVFYFCLCVCAEL